MKTLLKGTKNTYIDHDHDYFIHATSAGFSIFYNEPCKRSEGFARTFSEAVRKLGSHRERMQSKKLAWVVDEYGKISPLVA